MMVQERNPFFSFNAKGVLYFKSPVRSAVRLQAELAILQDQYDLAARTAGLQAMKSSITK